MVLIAIPYDPLPAVTLNEPTVRLAVVIVLFPFALVVPLLRIASFETVGRALKLQLPVVNRLLLAPPMYVLAEF